MKLYDSLIKSLDSLLSDMAPRYYPYSEEKAWIESDEFELLLQKDMAYELGANGKEAVNYTCITDDPSMLGLFHPQEKEDKILLYGKDLSEMETAHSYARILVVLIRPDEELEKDTEKLFQTLQDIDFVKYNVHPKGYMVRTSNQNHREQVRIGKKELKKGMTFEKIGNTFIRKYKQNPRVQNVCVIFITDETMDYKVLMDDAKQTASIRNSLSRMNKGLPTECSVCDIREICNEVEGLRELHFGSNKKQKAGVRI